METSEIVALGKEISKIIKKRFPNLTVEETNDIVGDIVIAVDGMFL